MSRKANKSLQQKIVNKNIKNKQGGNLNEYFKAKE